MSTEELTPPDSGESKNPLPDWALVLIKRLIAVSIIALVVFILYRVFARYDLHSIWKEVRNTSIDGLLLAAGYTALNYLVLTGYDTLAFRYIGKKLSYSRIGFTAFISYTFSHNVGAALVSGGAVRYRMYSKWGIKTGDITRVLLFSGFHFWAGLFVLGAIVCLIYPTDFADALHIEPKWSIITAIGMLVPIVYYLWLTLKPGRALKFREWRMDVPPLHLAFLALVLSCIDWLCAASVLYHLLPGYRTVHFTEVLVAFLAAQMGGVMSHVPGGFGVFESIFFVALSDHYRDEALVGSLVLYRFFYYFAPFILGALAYIAYEGKIHKFSIKNFRIKTRPARRALTAITPLLLAAGTFCSGVVLLFSGALPTDPKRTWWVQDLVPLVLVEFSHFTASIIGVLLLALSFHIRRRLDSAYWLTLLLLILGITSSIIKGFDFEEALILSALLGVFMFCRAHFYRRSALVSYMSLWQFLAIAAVVGASIWLGFFSYRHVEYTQNLWWEFAAESDAPRFLRASVITSLIALFFGLYTIVRPKPFKGGDTLDKVQTHILQILSDASTVEANIALLGDKYFLLNSSKTSFLMYRVIGQTWVALGDPIGPEEEKQDLIWQFRELSDLHAGQCAFYEVPPHSLPYYLDIGLKPLKLGEFASVSLESFSLSGNSMKAFRNTVNKLEKDEFAFQVIEQTEIPPLLPTLRSISDEWLNEKNTREKGFSLGFFNESYIAGCPLAVITHKGTIVAFANIWTTNKKAEFSVDLMRLRTGLPNGVMDYLFIKLMLWAKEHEYKKFNLGMAPLSGFDPHRLAPLWSRVGALVFRHGEHFYNFEGVRGYKEKFNPDWEPRYLVSVGGVKTPFILAQIASLISGGVSGVIRK